MRKPAAAAATVAALALATPLAAHATETPTDQKPFSPAAVFYQKLPDNTPTADDSDQLVAALKRQTETFYGTADKPNIGVNYDKFAPTLWTAKPTDPKVDVRPWNCQNKEPGWETGLAEQLTGIRIPAAMIPDPSSDGSVTIHDPQADTVVDLWQARKTGDQWEACWGGVIENASKSTTASFDSPFGASASGLAQAAYIIRHDELVNGRINHVINLGIPEIKAWPAMAWPANRTDGGHQGPALTMGQMLRLPADLDIDNLGLSPAAKTIARAAQEYGIMITETSGSVAFGAQNRVGMDGDDYDAIFGGKWATEAMAGFPIDKLEVLPVNYRDKPTTSTNAPAPSSSPADTGTPALSPTPHPTATPTPANDEDASKPGTTSTSTTITINGTKISITAPGNGKPVITTENGKPATTATPSSTPSSTPSATPKATPTATPSPVPDDDTQDDEIAEQQAEQGPPGQAGALSVADEIFRLTNEFRAENNLPPFERDTCLDKTAEKQSEIMIGQMAEQNDIFHSDLEDADNCPDTNGVGENIAAGQPDAATAVEDWKNSTEGHREAMLSTKYTHMGVGVTADNTYTQQFTTRDKTDGPEKPVEMPPAEPVSAPADDAPSTGLKAEQGLTPDALNLLRQVHQKWPNLEIGGVGQRPGQSDHPSGNAIDIMTGDNNCSPVGQEIADWTKQNADSLDVKYVIWCEQIWSVQRADEGWRPNTGHRDHVHISVNGDSAKDRA